MTERDQDVHTDTVTPAEGDAPNEYGYAGGASTPAPAGQRDEVHDHAEETAVPAGDLTGAVSDALQPSRDDDAR
ncbi:hypothetical protein [Spirilliplanes yamanashiensis]|uniref:Uncharacterized protein n=1 Tax=Spirilliplanes yamanashiensis TaxID=42233 RepID=A0A8J3YCP4_9ACTN|nr:hypothetical protein [Spirilliplanes yamanashiensis]MDP9818888.1 hypothetical protein [Spirilliplanes yamanashiensis]GIJ05342.1 hypothetical protein Sya03_46940 [Spirilliplanes yamanashiensis]